MPLSVESAGRLMNVIQSCESMPDSVTGTVFLAGAPTHDASDGSWRASAVEALAAAGFQHTIVSPEIDAESGLGEHRNSRDQQNLVPPVDAVFLWLPSGVEKLPGFAASVQFGECLQSGILFYGRADGGPATRYLDERYRDVTGREPANELSDLAEQVTQYVGVGSERSGGERCVPLHIWQTKHFQSWLLSQQAAGNRLDDARVLWQFVVPKVGFVLAFAVQVSVWVEAEGRHKSNEFILSRPDISCVVPYRLDPNDPLDSQVVLIREFRSPARTPDGFIHELPGGSSFKESDSVEQEVAEELREETGLSIAPERLRRVEPRQFAGTFATHWGYAFAIALTEEEMHDCRENAAEDVSFGNAAETEQTRIEVCSVRDVMSGQASVDWSMTGIILTTILG